MIQMKKEKSNNNKKNRIPVKWLAVIALIAIIIANFIVWKNYFGENSGIDALKSEVIAVGQQILEAEQPPSGLETKLQQATDNLTAALQGFPVNVDRNDVVDFILNTAEACDVQVLPLVSEGIGASYSGQSDLILRYSSTVTGKLNNATNFITMLRNGDYPTMVITECSVERVSGLDIDVSDSDLEVTIEISFALYTASIQVTKDTTS